MKPTTSFLPSSWVAALALTATLSAGSALAAPLYAPFTFTPGAGEQGTLTSFVANDIGGQYNETFTATSATDFAVSLVFEAGQFKYVDTNPALNNTFNAAQTGLGFNYGLYALFQATGTYVNTAAGPQFTINPGGSFSFFMDVNNNTEFTAPATGLINYGRVNFGDDVLLATGQAVEGIGVPAAGPNLSGAFGQTTTFNLTPAGMAVFTAPVPFYNFSLQSGQFTSFPVVIGATTNLTGTLNARFINIPEPMGLALAGMALVAAGVATRSSRRQQAA